MHSRHSEPARRHRRAQARDRAAKQRRFLLLSGTAALLALAVVALLLGSRVDGSVPTTAQAETSATAPPTATVPEQLKPDIIDPAVEEGPSLEDGVVTIGYSVNSAAIEAYRLGDGDRRLLVLGGVHGNEWGTDIAEQLLERLQTSPELVPEGVEIHIIPCMNPDGLAANTRENARGVDLNRNMPASTWGAELDPQDSAARRGLSSGESPGSEPESQAFIQHMQVGFHVVVSLHSQGGLIDWDGEGGEAIARRMSDITGLPAQHLGYQPYITGSMGQYVPEKWGIPIITVELNSATMDDPLFQAILSAIR